jgi:adenylate cyclase
MGALEVKLTEGEQARMRIRGTANLEALMKTLKALSYIRHHNIENNILAKQELRKAISIAPDYSGAYAALAMTHILDVWLGTENPLISFAQASKFVKQAISLDPNNSDAYLTLSILNMARRNHEQAIAAAEKAIALNPNGADAYSQLAFALYISDRPIEAVELFKKAIRLNPMPPGYYYINLGTTYRALEMYKKALDALTKAIELEPNNIFAHLHLASVYSLLGKEEDARAEATEVLKIDPKFSLNDIEEISMEKNRAYVKLFIESLRNAGLK